MRVAVAGKGGTGKTTVAGTLARLLARRGRPVLAVDADTNPNLAAIAGLESGTGEEFSGLPSGLLERVEGDDGPRSVLTRPAAEVVDEYAAPGPDGVRVMVMGRVGHAGKGCMCRAHSSMRAVVGEVVGDPALARQDVVMDMEAGLEHLSRGTGRHVDVMVAVVEPYYRALETGRRVVELARELGTDRIVAVPNKVRDDGDRKAVGDYLQAQGIAALGEVPFDGSLLDAERAGLAPIDHDPESPAVRAIGEVLTALEARVAGAGKPA